MKDIDKIKTFEDVCEIVGIDANKFNQHCLEQYLEEDEIAYKKLKLIISVINEGWKPDWEDKNEYKYYPYFNMAGSFSFVVTNYHYEYSVADVSSRLCFKTKNDAIYTANHFLDLYRIFYTYEIPKRNTLFEKFKK